jgi:hypothetical protein
LNIRFLVIDEMRASTCSFVRNKIIMECGSEAYPRKSLTGVSQETGVSETSVYTAIKAFPVKA